MDNNAVEDMIVADDRFDLMDVFFAPNGSKKLMLFHQVCICSNLQWKCMIAMEI